MASGAAGSAGVVGSSGGAWGAGAGGQDRAAQDQDERAAHGQGQVLVQDEDAQRDRDGRVDVGDDRGPGRADLGDQGEEDHEGGGRADRAQGQQRQYDVGRRQLVRPGHDGGHQVDQGGHGQAHGVDPGGRDVGQLAVGDDRADGVTQRGEQHRGHRQRVPVGRVRPGQHGHPGQPDDQAGPAHQREPVRSAGEPGQHRPDDRHGRHQQAAGRAGQVLFRAGEQRERADDLNHGKRDQPAPVAAQRTQLTAAQRDREQQQGTQRDPDEHQHRDRDAAVRHLDQQVRDTPDEAHRGEQHPAPSAHGRAPFRRSGRPLGQSSGRPEPTASAERSESPLQAQAGLDHQHGDAGATARAGAAR